MNKLLIVVVAACALALPGLANAADVTGAWTLVISAAEMTYHATCNLTQTGLDLSGTCVPSDPPQDGGTAPKPSAVTGRVDGSNVAFGYDITFGDMPLHLAYTGAMSSDTAMAGKLEVAGMEGTFTATKS